MKKTFIIVLIAGCIAGKAFTQAREPADRRPTEAPAPTQVQEQMSERLLLATSSEDYPVTPGDLYRLTYRQGETLITNYIPVEADSRLRLGFFGTIDANRMTFIQAKQSIENLINRGSPRSLPSLTISAIGVFRVLMRGETIDARYFTAWGLSRVSDVVAAASDPTVSSRNVEVVSLNGALNKYDLIKALRSGILARDNPYVKPGDTVILHKSERRVTISGEVHAPGTYELLPTEQLWDLVETYASGFTNRADAARLRIERQTGDAVRVLYSDLGKGYSQEVPLEDGDAILIPPKSESLPMVYFEGAVIPRNREPVAAQQPTEATAQPAAAERQEYNRIPYTFREGEKLSDALRVIREEISPLGDLSAATILREGNQLPIAIDLRPLLASSSPVIDTPLKMNDRIIIPLIHFSIFVSGSVVNPGTYPFAPDRTYHYFVSLAGGSAQDDPENIIIIDPNGNRRNPADVIHPEDRIYVLPTTVSVQGAVFTPGNYPYQTGLPATHYVRLAGGINPEMNWGGAIKIYDSAGKPRSGSKNDPLKSGDWIYVPTNNLFYNLREATPLLLTIVSIIATSVTVYNAFQ